MTRCMHCGIPVVKTEQGWRRVGIDVTYLYCSVDPLVATPEPGA